MNIKFTRWWLSAALALTGLTIVPAMADQWDKETHFEFSAPVEIPGQVLMPGKYVFKLGGESDRNVVQIFSEDENGNRKLKATVLTIPKYALETPEKPAIRFEERASSGPEAINSWFYPGDNTGWEFVYPKSERLEARSSAVVAEQPAPAPAAAPVAPEPPAETPPTATVTEVVVEQVVIAQEEAPAFLPTVAADTQSSTEPTLPQTADYSAAELMAGVTMLSLGLGTFFVWLRKAEA
jgi:hypothetical protein